MSYVKNLGFLQLTALLLIGAEARRVHCPSCVQPPSALWACSKSSRQFDPVASGAWSESRPCAFHPPAKATLGRRLSLASGKGTQNSPTSLWREAHLDRERNRRWAEHCSSVNEIGAKACFMVPRWNASAHVCRGKCDRASTDEWSPTKASGSALTYS